MTLSRLRRKHPVNSFDGDSKSDILWQSNNGTAAVWLMDGTTATTVTAAGSFNPGPTWHVKGSGDFNGDGKSDILWQNDNGTAAMWLMDGTNSTFVGAVGPFNPGPTWHIEGTGDFNGDGKSDILWQSDNGTAAIWLMDGTNADVRRRRRPVQSGADLAHQGHRRLQRRRQVRHPLAERQRHCRDLADGRHQRHVCRRRRLSIRGRAGRSRAPATSTATASPTSCGRTTMARRRSG